MGDVRGGVGVIVPMTHYYQEQAKAVNALLWTHGGIWILGLGGIAYICRQNIKRAVEHHRAQSVLQESEVRFRTLVENAVDAFFLIDVNGDIRDVNTRACESLGYSRDELLTLNVSDFDVDFPKDKLDQFIQLVEDQGTQTAEGTHKRKDGDQFPVEVRVGPIEIERQPHLMAQVRDISERKEAETRRQRDEVRLAAQYDLAMYHAENERDLIEYAIEEGVRLTRSTGTYLHFFHHESREIELYTWSKGVLEICTALEEKHYQLEMAGIWADCLREGKPAIHNDYPGMEGKKGLPEEIPPLIERTLELAAVDYDLKKKYDFRNIEIVRETGDDLPLVPCIASEMQQVLLNLLRNSAQALFEQKERGEHARITLTTCKEDGMFKIVVEDDGPGMDEETTHRVFEPFFTTRPVGQGTGLGLSVSYFIVCEEHGGRMSVDSVPGQGTAISIYLPLEA
ncbi:hypothetical protein BOW51_05800 [Solemya velesiana gill symbiont]|uniref:histidine kinase n=1 Tax=Solemya velesiana gill symbiont TaxID=1918948 RepID=A0A1T2KV39_9GAMM|nr:hypothetical protein BOW51_05800 [Solemya velesiana gill symbiont]